MKEIEAEAPRDGNRVARALWAVGGFATFGLGALGAMLPIVPTTPFLLVAAFCFARSSERARAWFRGTRLYRTVLEGYMSKRAMTVRAKLSLLVPITAVLAVSFALMGSVPVGRVVVALVWVAHLVSFGFVVKTVQPEAAAEVRSTTQGMPESARRAGTPLVTDGEGA